MASVRRVRPGNRRPRRAPSSLSIPAAQFKTQCLALMDRVDRTGEEIIVTKHRRPVAKLVSVRTAAPPRPFFGRSRGLMQVVGDIVAPIDADWTVDGDL